MFPKNWFKTIYGGRLKNLEDRKTLEELFFDDVHAQALRETIGNGINWKYIVALNERFKKTKSMKE